MQFRRDLVAVRNRYEYAVKTKEEDRVLRCVAGLRKIADDYEAPDALQIAGRMLWRLGRREQGRDLFVDATQARNDSLYCFDLAMAQRLTGELDHAAATLRHCLREDSQPRALALMALTAIVLTEDTGWAELAGLVQDAAHWRAGVARLAVLHCGLICVSRADLTGFPGDQWDSADAAPEAFATLAQALHAGATPSATAGAPASPSGTGTVPAQTESAASAATDAGPIEAAAVKALAVEVHACLNRRDVLAAERAFAQLKRVAPQDSLTWGAERALSNARSRGASAGPVPGPPRGSVRWPALPVLRVAVDAVRQMGVLRTLLVDGWNHYLATRA
jgi:hypothetical protein